MEKFDKSISIFIIDDDKPLNAMLKASLNKTGYLNVNSYYSGEEGLKNIEETPPDLVLQDYELPGINGLQVLKKVKKKFPSVEFIMFSGQTDMEVAIKALTAGAFDYVIKDNFAKENAKFRIERLLRIKKGEADKKMLKIVIRVVLGVMIASWIAIFLGTVIF